MTAKFLDRFRRKALYTREDILALANKIESETVSIESVHEMIDAIKAHGFSEEVYAHISNCLADMKANDKKRDKTRVSMLFARLLLD